MVERLAVLMGAVLILAGAMHQDPSKPGEGKPKDGAKGPEEARKTVVAALEQSNSKGGAVLKGRLEFKKPADSELAIVFDEAYGREIEGAFTAQVAKGGLMSASFSSKSFKYDLFCRDGRTVHRLSWLKNGVPMPRVIGHELSHLLRLDHLLKHLGREKDIQPQADESIEGMACQVFTALISPDALPLPGNGTGEERDDPYDVEPESITAIFAIGRVDHLIRRLELRILREMHNPGPIPCENRYTLTVQKYDPDLKIEIPTELVKFLK